MYILGISCYYHDSAASLVKDGIVVAAAAEERFSRIKHDNGFPEKAIRFCLDYAGIAANELGYIAFYEKPIVKFERILSTHLAEFPKSTKTFINSMGSWLSQKLKIKEVLINKFNYHGKVLFVPHHLCHAAASYLLSDFNEASIVTIDGVGEWSTTTYGLGKGTKIVLEKEVRFPHSLGLLYSAFTAYLGFKVNSAEYKVMGLASYGNPNIFRRKLDKVIKLFSDGSFALDMKYFDYTWSDHMPNNNLEILLGYPKREPESEVRDHYANIAASLQQKLEDCVFNLLNAVYKKHRIGNLSLGGAVALNSVLNGKIVKNTPFKRVYIHPDPGDAGGAIGAALLASNLKDNVMKKRAEFSSFLGPEFRWFEIKKVLDKYNLNYKLYTDEKTFLKAVVKHLTNKKIVGWFQGRMEWGPRALGARSILASAKDPLMKSILNEKVKKRETFRPFAPAILDEYVDEYFYTKDQPMGLGKYMLLVLPFRKKGVKEAGATVHVDKTGRLQSIKRAENPLYYDLIETYMKKTGSPIIINTSFNIRGEPIVCTPEDAVKCFLGTGIDVLVADKYIITK